MHARRRSSVSFSLVTLAVSAVLGLSALPVRAALPDIFPDPAQAKADLGRALQQARREHKRIILDFGGNWCGDCHVLDTYFHDPSNAGLLAQNYVVVPINIGRYDQNQDLADKYQVPLKKGVPALAVLDDHGRVLYSQKNGEFESMRRMDSSAVTDFLMRWKPARQVATSAR